MEDEVFELDDTTPEEEEYILSRAIEAENKILAERKAYNDAVAFDATLADECDVDFGEDEDD